MYVLYRDKPNIPNLIIQNFDYLYTLCRGGGPIVEHVLLMPEYRRRLPLSIVLEIYESDILQVRRPLRVYLHPVDRVCGLPGVGAGAGEAGPVGEAAVVVVDAYAVAVAWGYEARSGIFVISELGKLYSRHSAFYA